MSFWMWSRGSAAEGGNGGDGAASAVEGMERRARGE